MFNGLRKGLELIKEFLTVYLAAVESNHASLPGLNVVAAQFIQDIENYARGLANPFYLLSHSDPMQHSRAAFEAEKAKNALGESALPVAADVVPPAV